MLNGDEEKFNIRLGPVKVGASGAYGIGLLLVCMIIGSIIWTNSMLQIELRNIVSIIGAENAQRRLEHQVISRTQDRTACVLSLTPEERSIFRKSRESFSKWCSWVDD